MTAASFALVLAAAALHAGWNALVKRDDDPLLGSAAVVAWGGLVTALALAFLPLPPPAAWPALALSVAIHVAYFWLLGLVYRRAPLSAAYPVVRGSAPPMALMFSFAALGERPSTGALLGVASIAAGIVALARDGGRGAPARAFPLALACSATIALYTVVDAAGARISGRGAAGAFGYDAAAGVGRAACFVLLFAATRGRAGLRALAARASNGLAGGAASFLAYGTVLYAMTLGPVAPVAALRESSTLFGAALGVLWLGERFSRAKATGIALVAMGGVALRFA